MGLKKDGRGRRAGREEEGNDDLQASEEQRKVGNKDEGERRDWSCESPGKRNGSRLTVYSRAL